MICRLAKEPNVVGIKDSSGSLIDMVNYMDPIERAGSKAHFLTGREEALLAGDFRQDIFRLSATVLEVTERDIHPPRHSVHNGRCPCHDAGHAVPGGLQTGP